MSLTSILKDPKNVELKEIFKSEFPRPAFNIKSEPKAPPLTKNWSIVGTAFDYLFRFYLEHLNKNSLIIKGNWVADLAYSKLLNQVSKSKKQQVSTGYLQDKVIKITDLLETINQLYNQTKLNYAQYIKTGTLTEDLISNTIFLAKLDNYFRSTIIDHDFATHNKADIEDLSKLISLVNPDNFMAKDRLYFNPTFGNGSYLVGGADADLIIDDTLIDIKVIKDAKLDREHLNQILRYYILSLYDRVSNSSSTFQIEKLGIYFARHGELWTIPTSQFGDKRKFEDFTNWFVTYVSKLE
jgi:hypothetical protein